MGTIQGFCASSQASAIWAGVAPFLRGDPLQQINHRPVGFDRLRRKAGIAAADIGAVEGRVLVNLAGQVAPSQRAVGHKTDAEFLAGGQDGLLRCLSTRSNIRFAGQ